jgi:hypothetical protein
MGMIEDIEAAERARARGEPEGGQSRRRLGVLVLIIGVVLTLAGTYLTSWQVIDFHVGGSSTVRLRIGLWSSEMCPDRGECEPLEQRRARYFVNEGTRSADATVDAWFDSRWQAGFALAFAATAAAVLIGSLWSQQAYRRSRGIAIALFIIAGTALLIAARSAFAEPLEFMSLGLGAYLAMLGVVDLMLGAIMIGIAKTGPGGPIPPAQVVVR